MTSATARTVANVVLVSAGLAAAYVVVTTPPLRRLALRGTEWWLGRERARAYLLSRQVAAAAVGRTSGAQACRLT